MQLLVIKLCAHLLFIAWTSNIRQFLSQHQSDTQTKHHKGMCKFDSVWNTGFPPASRWLGQTNHPHTRQRCHGGPVCTLSVKRLATDRRVRPLRPGLRFPYSPANARALPLPFTSDSMWAKHTKELKADTVLHRTNDTSASITHFVTPGAPPCRNGPLRKRAPPIEPDWGNT